MNKNKFDAKKSSLVFLLAFLIAQFVLSFWQIILKGILKTFKYHNVENFVSNPFLYMIFTLAQTLVFIGIFIFCYRNLNLKENIKSKKLSVKWLCIFLLFGVVALFSLSYFINYFTIVLNLAGYPSTALPYEINSWPSYILSIITLAIFPAVGEELLFRGTLFNGLKSKGKLFAVVMTSVMFSIFHFSLAQLYYPLLFGMLLGLAYAYTDNLLVPIGMHFLNNAINITIQFMSTSNLVPSIKLYQVIVGVAIYLIILFICLLLLNKKEEKDKNEIKSKNLETPQEKILNDDLEQVDKRTIPFYKTETFKIFWPIAVMIILYILVATIS